MIKYYQTCIKQGLGLMALLVGLSSACSNPGKARAPETSSPESDVKSDADAKAIAPTKVIPTRIVMSFKNVRTLKNLSGYVVNAIDDHAFKATPDAPGRFALNSLKPGRYDIILEGQRASDLTSAATFTDVGIRINGINVVADEDTVLREEVDLPPSFSIKGKIHLLDGVTHGAIALQIPGTRYKAVTAADGSYSLDKVPNGQHSIVVSNPGFLKGTFEARNWPTASNELSTLTLLPEDQVLPTGVHYKGQGLSATELNKVTLFLNRPSGTSKFRWSETSDFVGSTWEDYQSSVEINLPAGGDRRVFVQFASKDTQQLSAVYTIDFPPTPVTPP